MAHHWKTGQLGSAAGRRRPYAPLGEEARRGRALLPRILGLVVVLSVLSFAVSTSPASAATPTRSTATAEWSIRDGCVRTDIALSTQTSGGAPRTSFYIEQGQTCDDPNRYLTVLTLEGSIVDGQLRVSRNLNADLVATVPVTCTAYESGACDQAPYDAESLVVDLSWDTTGRILHVREDGVTCRYRYGTATGSVLLGGVNLLSTGGVAQPSDATETNVHKCIG